MLERLNDGNNNGQLRIAKATLGILFWYNSNFDRFVGELERDYQDLNTNEEIVTLGLEESPIVWVAEE